MTYTRKNPAIHLRAAENIVSLFGRNSLSLIRSLSEADCSDMDEDDVLSLAYSLAPKPVILSIFSGPVGNVRSLEMVFPDEGASSFPIRFMHPDTARSLAVAEVMCG